MNSHPKIYFRFYLDIFPPDCRNLRFIGTQREKDTQDNACVLKYYSGFKVKTNKFPFVNLLKRPVQLFFIEEL